MGKLLEIVWLEPKSPNHLNWSELIWTDLNWSELIALSRATISRMIKQGQTSCNRRKSKLTDRARRALKRTVGRKYQTTGAKVITELNQHLNSLASTKTVRCRINKAGYHGNPLHLSPLSTFRSGWSGVEEIPRAGLQTHGSKWYSPRCPVFYFPNSEESLFVRAAQRSWELWPPFYLHWSNKVDQWWFEQPFRGILSVSSLPIMVGSTAWITWTFWEIMFIQWSMHYSLMVKTSSKTSMLRYIPVI